MIRDIHDYFVILLSGFFDREYYLRNNPDVRAADIDPLWHFVHHGWKEGRNPFRDFDTDYYNQKHQDVQFSQINPLVHYIKHGRQELRSINCQPERLLSDYQVWLRKHGVLSQKDFEKINRHQEKLQKQPLISMILPIKHVDCEGLLQSFQSLQNQTYPYWECIVAAAPSIKRDNYKCLSETYRQDQRFVFLDLEVGKNAAIAATDLINGEWVFLLDQGDQISPHALYLIVNEINQEPESVLVYSDEDQIDASGYRFDPLLKPSWNQDLALTHHYVGRLCVFNVNALKYIGGFRATIENAFEWDALLRITKLFPTASIRHIPFILYHHMAVEDQNYNRFAAKKSDFSSQYNVLMDYFEENNTPVDIETLFNQPYWRIKYSIPHPTPYVSVVISTRNKYILLSKCINSLIERTQYPNYEIIVINNLSDEQETLNYLHKLSDSLNIRVIDYPHAFNYSAINNFAVGIANGEVIIFLNNDIEIITPGWMGEMVSQALRPEIGSVGAMLYYPDYQIQHAGIIVGIQGTAGHAFQGQPKGSCGYTHRACLVQNYSAVTAACMAVQKDKFLSVGGFNESDLAIALNDVDLCLRLQRAGFRTLWTPHAELYHLESASRGSDQTLENIPRYHKETTYFKEKYYEIIDNDPAYNPNLTLDYSDFRLASPPRIEKPWL